MDNDNEQLLDLMTKSVELLNNKTGSETVDDQVSFN